MVKILKYDKTVLKLTMGYSFGSSPLNSNGSYSLFQFERSDVISVLKNLPEYSFVFFKCLVIQKPRG